MTISAGQRPSLRLVQDTTETVRRRRDLLAAEPVELRKPTTAELIEALNAPGRLTDQPAVRALLACRAAQQEQAEAAERVKKAERRRHLRLACDDAGGAA